MNGTLLCRTPLFWGTTPQQAEGMLECLGARERGYAKGERICRAGERVTELGMVLAGSVLIQSDDAWGTTTVLDRVGAGQIFAETYACTGEPLMVDVVAAEEVQVLFLDVGRVLQTCPDSCGHHSVLIANLLTLLAQKNRALSRKIFYTSSKSIRGRLLSYLSDQARARGSRSFTIPFDRQQLADYLNVERSALSGELGKMQREGLLRTRRSYFQLLAGSEDSMGKN